MKTLTLPTEPTVRQAEAILARLAGELASRGVAPQRRGLELRFRVPPPWRAPGLGTLAAITGGTVKVSAGAGEPWRVRYALDFTVLRGLALFLTVVAILAGLSWPRLTLVNVVAGVWLLVYLAPRLAADRRFTTLVRRSAASVLDRRRTPQDVPVA